MSAEIFQFLHREPDSPAGAPDDGDEIEVVEQEQHKEIFTRLSKLVIDYCPAKGEQTSSVRDEYTLSAMTESGLGYRYTVTMANNVHTATTILLPSRLFSYEEVAADGATTDLRFEFREHAPTLHYRKNGVTTVVSAQQASEYVTLLEQKLTSVLKLDTAEE